MTDGKIVWIEEGKLGEKASGLAHIWEKRGSDFTARGISKEEIPEFIINAVTIGKSWEFRVIKKHQEMFLNIIIRELECY